MIGGLDNLDETLELFAVKEDLKAFYKGQIVDFSELPAEIMDELTDLMLLDKPAMKILIKTCKTTNDMVKQYSWCNFGGINHESDIDNGKFITEYWDCGKRGACPFEGKICALKILGKRELEFAKLLATGLLDKEIASEMNITYTTACDYRVRIQQKTGTTNKVELVNWLHRQNLID